MKGTKKHGIIIGSIIAALFIAPLVVLAIIYTSSVRRNSFQEGSVDIEVHEENGTGPNEESEMLSKEYQWTANGSDFIANKDVKIKDTRKNPGEKLRVSLIPMWLDNEDNVCGVFDFGSLSHTDGSDTFTYTDDDMTITLNMAQDWDTKGWEYEPADGCFYYSGPLNGNDLTAQLLESVEINSEVYDSLTADHKFRLDVLADAIQNSGYAAETRNWNTTTTTTTTTTTAQP